MILKKMLDFSKYVLDQILVEGDVVIDATAGNGYDTVYLSQRVGESGKVFAFDIQENAIKSTRTRLSDNNCHENVSLFHDGHENMDNYLACNVDNQLKAAVFNLGYLPGDKKHLVTQPETTLKALEFCLDNLVKGGMLSIAVYVGHPGGKEEAEVVKGLCSKLKRKEYGVLEYSFINERDYPHCLILVEKR